MAVSFFVIFFKFLRFLVDDFRRDFVLLRNLFSGRRVVSEEQAREWREWDFYEVFKVGWIFLLLLVAAFFAGQAYRERVLEGACNEFVVEEGLVPLSACVVSCSECDVGLVGDVDWSVVSGGG